MTSDPSLRGPDVGVLVEDESRRLTFTNAAYCELFGLREGPAALVGTDGAEAAVAAAPLFADPGGFLREIGETLAQARERTTTLRLLDGRTWERRYVPVPGAEGRHGHVWVYRDVTAERATSRAEGGGLPLERLGVGLRTPLHAIIGLADLCASVEDAGEARELGAALRRAAHDLLWTVEGLLALADDRAAAAPAAFDPVGVVEDAVSALAVSARDRDLSLRLLVRGGVPARATGHPGLLRHLLTNLLAGLLESREVGGLAVEADGYSSGRGQVLEVRVCGTGEGRAEGHPADRAGLALSEVLARRLGATLQREPSEEGRAVTLRVPIGPSADPEDPPGPPWAGLRVGVLGPSGPDTEAVALTLARLGTSVVGPWPLGSWSALPQVDAVVVAASPADLERVEVDGRGSPLVWVGGGEGTTDHPVTRRRLASALREALGRRPAPLAPAEGGGADQVLVVEDSPANAAVIDAMLRRAGWSCRVVGTGEEAVEAFREHPWSLVLLDLDLPDLPGERVAALLREHESRAGRTRTPIVACTAQVTPDARRRCRDVGVDGFLPKPFHRARLLAEVERWRAQAPAVLVVDDSPDTHLLYDRWLADLGARVSHASTGAEGLALFAAHGPAVVVVDVDMPGMDGIEVTRRLRSQPGGARTRVLVVTGHGDGELRRAATEAGADAVLVKPIGREILVDLVRTLVSAAAPPAPAAAAVAARSHPTATVDADVAELVPAYLEDRRADVGRARALLAEGRFEGIARLGHQMKGSGASYGFPDVTALGASLEGAAAAGDGAECGRAIDALERYLGAVEVVVRG